MPEKFILWFKEVDIKDILRVGGKNASLGEMYQKLTKKGINIPNGFCVTDNAYRYFLKKSGILPKLKEIMVGLDTTKMKNLLDIGAKARETVLKAKLPDELKEVILKAYRELCKKYKMANLDVAVRSSATAEDLPKASFAGQFESYLNIRGEKALLEACKKCFASFFTNRAISYRVDQGFGHFDIYLCLGIQKMIRSDKASAGIMFTLDTETGFRNATLISAAYGLGENIVKGRVNPDQYYVFKPTLKKGFSPIISKTLGTKNKKLIYAQNKKATHNIQVSKKDQKRFVLSDEEILTLAKWACLIENHYRAPQDIEWAKDGLDKKLYIVQSRPETVHTPKVLGRLEEYILQKRGRVLCTGNATGTKIGQGKAKIIFKLKDIGKFKKGEVLVTKMTNPDWEPVMKVASAIVTDTGGRTSHAAIVSRELGIPCLVGTDKATKIVKQGQKITVSCSEGDKGYVYEGLLPFKIRKTDIGKIKRPKTKIMMNLGDPGLAFSHSFIPSDGVGLAREEFIISNYIRIHPQALLYYNKVKDKIIRGQIDQLTHGYKNKAQFFVDKLAEGVAKIACAFYPKDVIVRFSDFKTNEYVNLIGGKYFEPEEENPMLGWRGASRYYDPKYKEAFGLECQAIKKVRVEMGLDNVIVMIPFCRTIEEGKKVLEVMKEYGLERGKKGLQVYVMCEIPSNVILAKEFSKIFDGFSIGSNDLTQLTLGVDRDSRLVSHVFDERNQAVKNLIQQVINQAHRYKRKVGICGQAPSDFPDFAQFLVEAKIDSISLNPDTVLKTTLDLLKTERKLKIQ
jgi:pyruvate,water dikinase